MCILSHQVKRVEGNWQLSGPARSFSCDAINALTKWGSSRRGKVRLPDGVFSDCVRAKNSPVHVQKDDL